MESLKVKDYMIYHPITFKKEMSLSAALHQVISSDNLGGPVIDDLGNVIGFLSEHDLLEKLVKVSYFCQEHYTVGDCMTADVIAVHSNLPIIELAEMMQVHRPKAYPVIDDGKLVGLITRRAVLKAIEANITSCFSRQV